MAQKIRKGKRKWFPIYAPTMFNNQLLGETFVWETETIPEKHLTINLMSLTGNPKKQNYDVFFKVVDVKAPASGESGRNRWENLEHLQPHDQIKFVVAGRDDFDWAVETIRRHDLQRWDILFSPVWETLAPTDLADWLLESGLDARLQLQMHKLLWGDQPGK